MNWRILLFVPAVLLGVLAFRALQPAPGDEAAVAETERVFTVEAFVPDPGPVAVSVEGFGRVEPVRTWEGVSQVDGRIVEMLDDLAEGTIIDEGTVILRIDPRSYEIDRDRAEANLRSAEAELAELDARVTTVEGQLELERRIEDVIEVDFDRRRQLLETGATSASNVDQVQRDLIGQQRRVLDLENELALIPVQRISAEASLRTREVELEDAERSLSNTVIEAPFTGRVVSVEVGEGEYVRTGESLATLAGIEAVEVVAEVQPQELIAALELLLPDGPSTFARLDLTDQNLARQVIRLSRLQPVIRLPQQAAARYPAEIVRIDGSIDEASGTIGIVVRVDQGGVPNLAERRPPLADGSFVTVEFRAETEDARLTLPREAVQRDGGDTFLYVATADDTLARREISSVARAGGRVVVEAALEDGDRIVTVPPEPAILGQSLEVVSAEVGAGQ
ncbi:MAG: HlyD family efflux transporter periplasmic adaptor subunit [Paracoccaceae bacterium]|nr:HlyD family efflux transporter periplasmic adaptor subunit [Paracoccaceae bacterium]